MKMFANFAAYARRGGRAGPDADGYKLVREHLAEAATAAFNGAKEVANEKAMHLGTIGVAIKDKVSEGLGNLWHGREMYARGVHYGHNELFLRGAVGDENGEDAWIRAADEVVGLSNATKARLRDEAIFNRLEYSALHLSAETRIHMRRAAVSRIGLTDLTVDDEITRVFTKHGHLKVWNSIRAGIKEPMLMSPVAFTNLVLRSVAAQKDKLDADQEERLHAALGELREIKFLWNHFRL